MLVIGFKRTHARGIGFHIIILRILRYFLNMVIRSYHFFYLGYNSNFINPLLQDNLMIYKQLSNKYKLVIIKTLEEIDFLDTRSYLINEHIISQFRRCIDRNGFVYLVYDKNKLIFRMCVQKGEYLQRLIGNAFIKIPELDYCLENGETHIKYRGQRIYPWVLTEIKKELVKTRHNEVYGVIYIENIASRKGLERAGFKLKETYVLFNIFLRTYKLHEVVYFGKSKLIQVPWNPVWLRRFI